MTTQMMNIRTCALGLFVLAGAGCPGSRINEEHCSHAKGDETCTELFGRGFCSLDQEGCPGEGVQYGCVFFERPTDECYSPIGDEATCAGPNPPSECVEVADESEETEMTETSETSGASEMPGDSEGSDTSETFECGDGVTDPGEQCDDGDSDDTNNCTNGCTNAKCGDSIVHKDVEECEDGNSDDTDACTNACKFAKCGDSITQEGVEECDGGNLQNNDGCSSGCEWEYRYVFVSSTVHDGALGGLAGADGICNALAAAAEPKLPGTYMAWISTEWGSPETRFERSTVPYLMPDEDQTIVADDWDDLVDGSIDHSINVTESGDEPPAANVNVCTTELVAWTGTLSDGTAGDPNGHCQNFTSQWVSQKGTPGRTDSDNWMEDDDWTNCAEPGPSCNKKLPIYCFQQ